MRLLGLGLLTWILCGAPAGTAWARGGAADQRAREHYDRGLAHYNLGEFEQAISEFKQAYAISGAPRLLFNIAQAQRLAKDWAAARFSYQAYLRLVPDAPNRADAEAKIAEMEQNLAEAESPKPEPTPPPEPAPEPEPAPTPAPAAAPPQVQVAPPSPSAAQKRLRIAGLVTLGAGVAALATAIPFGLSSQAASRELNDLVRAGGPWQPQHQARYDDGLRDQAIAASLYAAGGVAAAAGVVMTALGFRRAPRLALGPAAGGAHVTVEVALP